MKINNIYKICFIALFYIFFNNASYRKKILEILKKVYKKPKTKLITFEDSNIMKNYINKYREKMIKVLKNNEKFYKYLKYGIGLKFAYAVIAYIIYKNKTKKTDDVQYVNDRLISNEDIEKISKNLVSLIKELQEKKSIQEILNKLSENEEYTSSIFYTIKSINKNIDNLITKTKLFLERKDKKLIELIQKEFKNLSENEILKYSENNDFIMLIILFKSIKKNVLSNNDLKNDNNLNNNNKEKNNAEINNDNNLNKENNKIAETAENNNHKENNNSKSKSSLIKKNIAIGAITAFIANTINDTRTYFKKPKNERNGFFKHSQNSYSNKWNNFKKLFGFSK